MARSGRLKRIDPLDWLLFFWKLWTSSTKPDEMMQRLLDSTTRLTSALGRQAPPELVLLKPDTNCCTGTVWKQDRIKIRFSSDDCCSMPWAEMNTS